MHSDLCACSSCEPLNLSQHCVADQGTVRPAARPSALSSALLAPTTDAQRSDAWHAQAASLPQCVRIHGPPGRLTSARHVTAMIQWGNQSRVAGRDCRGARCHGRATSGPIKGGGCMGPVGWTEQQGERKRREGRERGKEGLPGKTRARALAVDYELNDEVGTIMVLRGQLIV